MTTEGQGDGQGERWGEGRGDGIGDTVLDEDADLVWRTQEEEELDNGS